MPLFIYLNYITCCNVEYFTVFDRLASLYSNAWIFDRFSDIRRCVSIWMLYVEYFTKHINHLFVFDNNTSRVSCLFISFLAIESIADEQHFRFQSVKHSVPPAARSEHRNKVSDSIFWCITALLIEGLLLTSTSFVRPVISGYSWRILSIRFL